MSGRDHIGKVISWTNNPGEGWLVHRVSQVEIHHYKFVSDTKSTNYEPVTGDRVSFELTKNRKGLAYIRNVKFLLTGN